MRLRTGLGVGRGQDCRWALGSGFRLTICPRPDFPKPVRLLLARAMCTATVSLLLTTWIRL